MINKEGIQNNNNRRMKNYYLIVLILLTSNLSKAQLLETTVTNTIVETIPFELTSHNNIAIKAVFGGVDTLNLMFHTAAGSINLTTKATKRIKSIDWKTESDVGSWGGRATSRFSESNSLTIGKLHWDSLSVWEDENSGPTTDGKFGPNLFKEYFIEIDFDKSLMILHNTLPSKAAEYEKIPVIFKNDNLFIQGTSTIAGVDYKNEFLIHSGYGGALLYDDQFASESNIGDRIEITSEQELKDSFGNVIKVKKGTLPSLRIGNTGLTAVPVGFFEGKIGRQQMSVIGGDLLKRFNMIIGLNRAYIYLKTNNLKNIAYTQF
ncbi:hypothetical protein [Roseivirga sp.]|uniref:hypothetical protein n=1 Tax=Roseivirga sp. TaxID=1964215 RepID=UPI002B27B060|nr:hypothetical protein [Roseivirga sp.]